MLHRESKCLWGESSTLPRLSPLCKNDGPGFHRSKEVRSPLGTLQGTWLVFLRGSCLEQTPAPRS